MVSKFSTFHITCPDTNLVSSVKLRKPLSVKDAKAHFKHSRVSPERDTTIWAKAACNGSDYYGIYIPCDKTYCYIGVIPRSTSWYCDKVVFYRGCRIVMELHKRSEVTIRPTEYRTNYEWLVAMHGDYNDSDYLKRYIAFYNSQYGHLKSLPGFWDVRAANILLHYSCATGISSNLTKLNIHYLLSRGDITVHQRVFQAITNESYESCESLDLEEIGPALKQGLYIPQCVIQRSASSFSTGHETLTHLSFLMEASKLGRKLAPFRRRDFRQERKAAIGRIQRYLKTHIPRHSLADTILYQWELYKEGTMDEQGLRGQVASLVYPIIPENMLRLPGQEPLHRVDIPIYTLIPWLRKWYNSL